MSDRELARAFAAAWAAVPEGPVPDAVVASLTQLCERAHGSYPEIVVDDAELARAVARSCPADDPAGYIDRCRGGDLMLALAAGRGDPTAIATIERDHRGTIESVCRRFSKPSQPIEDLWQTLREKLFVASSADGHPKILDYAGQGLLDNWLRVTAIRCFLDFVKRKDRPREQPADDDQLRPLADPSDLALDVIKVEYRAAVTAAISEAARQLAAGDRQLLRMHLVAGLTIDQLGASFGIHRATAARRIARARQQLITSTREILATRLKLGSDELGDELGLVMSRIDMSLSKLLASGNREVAA